MIDGNNGSGCINENYSSEEKSEFEISIWNLNQEFAFHGSKASTFFVRNERNKIKKPLKQTLKLKFMTTKTDLSTDF